MALTIYQEKNVVVYKDSNKDKTYYYPLGTLWYSFDETTSLYNFYVLNPGTPIDLDLPYTSFRDKAGDSFNNDEVLKAYLNDAIAQINIDYGVETVPMGSDNMVMVKDEEAIQLQKYILAEARKSTALLNNIVDLDKF